MRRTSSIAVAALLIVSSWCSAHPGDASDEPVKPLVRIEVRDGYRYINSNGIPNHRAGQFPNRNNPNSISPQNYQFRVPLDPQTSNASHEVRGALFGVALNGIVFDPGTAEWWKDDPSLGWHMEAIGGPRNLGLDQNNAHVQPSGAYHYHGIPTGLIELLAGSHPNQPVLIGWAADGFPIYGPVGYSDAKDAKSALKPLRSSYRLKTGDRPSQPDAPGGKYDGAYTQDWEYVAGAGDLDECNGRFGVTPEFPSGTYCYVVNADYPYVPRLFKGMPDQSFMRHRPPGGPGFRPGRGRPGSPPPRPQ